MAIENPSEAAASTEDRTLKVNRARKQWISRLIDLTARNNLLYFRALKVGTLDLTGADRDVLAELLGGKSVSIWKLLPSLEEGERTTFTARLKEIARKARENADERGLETLFLSAGMASFKGEEGKRDPESPVLLMPLAIEARARGGPALKRNGDLKINPVLLHVLTVRFNLKLDPETVLKAADIDPDRDDDPFDLDALLAKLDELSRGVPQFEIRRKIVVGNFSFQKMAMVRDLTDHDSQLIENDLIASLAGDVSAQKKSASGSGASGSGVGEIDPKSFDRIAPKDESFALDADATQLAALHTALRGSSTVIQGPPGTGKSQVIANLIIAAAAAGKRVLFVAEKRAALEVVLARLARVGLERLALDLHGGDTSRKLIAARMQTALDELARGEPIVSEQIFERFTDRRQRLNDHDALMHTPRSPSGLSVFELQGKLLRSSAIPLKVRFRGTSLAQLDPKTAEAVVQNLNHGAALGALFLGNDSSPWAKANLTSGEAVQAAMDQAADLANKHWPATRATIEQLLSTLRAEPPKNLHEAKSLLDLLVDADAFLFKVDPSLFELNLNELTDNFAPALKGGFSELLASWFNGAFRRAKGQVRSRIRTDSQKPSALQLLAFITSAKAMQQRWTAAAFKSPHPVATGAAAAQQAVSNTLAIVEPLSKALASDELSKLSFDALSARLNALRDDPFTPRQIPALRKIETELNARGLSDMLGELRRSDLPADRWADAFRLVWLQSSLDHALTTDPALAGFNGVMHSGYVREFAELDRSRLELAAKRVAQKHVHDASALLGNLPKQAALIRREAQKKIRHLPFRQLMTDAPDVMAALFPCLMCSPLSVSQLLPANRNLFDLVIFDEASQVLPEDAVPSLMRGRQVVVAGDQHQLPPTQFFADGANEEESDAEVDAEPSAVDGFDSLLSMMSAFVPAPMLQWHYRSRDERLIAFSNQHIYGGRLITFPSPGLAGAVQHLLVEPSANEGGDDDSGSAEVRRVVDFVLDHAQRELSKPNARDRRSLGVIALGITHARRIEASLERALETRHELEPFFDPAATERCFVKNLERVQGDERDVIVLTLGVAPSSTGRVNLLRFGPLNSRESGYRRLNVAITRAREQMILVSSFSHHAIDAKTSSRGVELLRSYLQFAAAEGKLSSEDGAAVMNIPMNDFENDVATALAANGISTVPQWGASGYRIDLAAQHPDQPGRFVLAIECDGASYHSAPTARDRDRLRQQQLEALGWKFHRIWSTDWFTRRDAEIRRAVAAFQSACGGES